MAIPVAIINSLNNTSFMWQWGAGVAYHKCCSIRLEVFYASSLSQLHAPHFKSKMTFGVCSVNHHKQRTVRTGSVWNKHLLFWSSIPPTHWLTCDLLLPLKHTRVMFKGWSEAPCFACHTLGCYHSSSCVVFITGPVSMHLALGWARPRAASQGTE